MRRFAIAAACLLGLAGCIAACTPPQQAKVTQALSTPPGQLFCAIQTNGGGTAIVSAIDAAASSALPGAAPIAVLATGAAKNDVDTACANAAKATGGTSGIPVSPPASTVTVPNVAIPVPAGMPTSAATS